MDKGRSGPDPADCKGHDSRNFDNGNSAWTAGGERSRWSHGIFERAVAEAGWISVRCIRKKDSGNGSHVYTLIVGLIDVCRVKCTHQGFTYDLCWISHVSMNTSNEPISSARLCSLPCPRANFLQQWRPSLIVLGNLSSFTELAARQMSVLMTQAQALSRSF